MKSRVRDTLGSPHDLEVGAIGGVLDPGDVIMPIPEVEETLFYGRGIACCGLYWTGMIVNVDQPSYLDHYTDSVYHVACLSGHYRCF